MKTCQEVCENAQDYTDGKITGWPRVRIKLHILMCRNCRSFIDQTRQTKRLIRESLTRGPVEKVSPELMSAFRKQKK